MAKTAPSTHEHFWSYVHSIYSHGKTGNCVRRWCESCGKKEVGIVGSWRPERRGEFDQTPSEAIKAFNPKWIAEAVIPAEVPASAERKAAKMRRKES